MKITVIDCGSSKVPDIEKMLRYLDSEVNTIKLSAVSNKDLTSDGIVISGAPILLTETDAAPYLKQSSFIKEVNIPVLGICFGHQIIGMHFEAKIKRCNEDRFWQKIKFFGDTEITRDFDEDMHFMEDHCECIDLPKTFDLIASSITCEVEMIKHKEKNIFGVQFHPEVSGENGENLFRQFIQLCKFNKV